MKEEDRAIQGEREALPADWDLSSQVATYGAQSRRADRYDRSPGRNNTNIQEIRISQKYAAGVREPLANCTNPG